MSNIDFGHDIRILENEPLSKHSSFRIGGPAKYALFPKSSDELIYVVNTCKQSDIQFKIVGNASNILFDDKGFDGAVIFTEGLDSIEYIHRPDATFIKVGAGVSLTNLASVSGKKHSLSGLEFAYGIPGTVGGAIYMNAGAYGGQMSDVVVESTYYDIEQDRTVTITSETHKFGYRHSIYCEHPEYVILSATLKLIQSDPEKIFSDMSKNMASRKEKQPLEYPSAGSTFKRPEGYFAGKLIEDSGLKGYRVGGAQISEKHAGFTVNRGGATSKDVLTLIEYTKDNVKKNYGVELECEIIYIPYNSKGIV